VCGTLWADSAQRDFDCFAFSVPYEKAHVVAHLVTQAPAALRVFDSQQNLVGAGDGLCTHGGEFVRKTFVQGNYFARVSALFGESFSCANEMSGYTLTISCEPVCNGDVDDSGAVDVDDLLAIVNAWGPCLFCSGDLNSSYVIDVNDLLIVINHWGICPLP
jgi:hypothetical protein